MKYSFFKSSSLKFCFGLFNCFSCSIATSFAQSDSTAPNIVLILADDLALMDLGVYGGEAATPNIDRLANAGSMFTNYHSSPSCAPSRAMLMTGYDSHLTGVPNLPIFLPPDQINRPGYEGILNDTVQTVASRLKTAGYQTYISGKWHLGDTPSTLPTKRGFDRSFILNASGADNYEHKAYLPIQKKPPWFEDGQPIDLPKDFYSSRNLVDKMMQFMEEDQDSSKPFFAYLPFQAIHLPVQAPKEFVDKYEGVYAEGWDVLRQKRYEKAKDLGLIPADAPLGKLLPILEKWENQSDTDKLRKAKAMAVNAAMIEAMDYHIGRFLQFLESKQWMDNTIFIITSDNGPEASDPSLVTGMNLWLKWVGYHTDYERLGEKGSWNFIGPEFASAAAAPSAYFKFYAGEGGLRVPLIISGVGLPKAVQQKAFSVVTDITPTILDLAKIETNDPFTGRSLYPILQQQSEQVYTPEDTISIEVAGHAALFQGDYKIVRNCLPYGDGQWRMYNLAKDPGETINLATTQPTLFQQLLRAYDNYATTYKVLPLADDYDIMSETQRKFKMVVLNRLKPWFIGLGLLLVALFIWKYQKPSLSS